MLETGKDLGRALRLVYELVAQHKRFRPLKTVGQLALRSMRSNREGCMRSVHGCVQPFGSYLSQNQAISLPIDS